MSNWVSFSDFIDLCRAEAFETKLLPTEASVWRSLCRQYSKKFFTPLHEVYDLSPEHILLNLYEDDLHTLSLGKEEVLRFMSDGIRHMIDPDFNEAEEDDVKEFMDEAIEEEAKRVALGKPIHKDLADENFLVPKNTSQNVESEEPKKPLPTSGSLDLRYLEKFETEE